MVNKINLWNNTTPRTTGSFQELVINASHVNEHSETGEVSISVIATAPSAGHTTTVQIVLSHASAQILGEKLIRCAYNTACKAGK